MKRQITDRWTQRGKRVLQLGRLMVLGCQDLYRFWRYASLSAYDRDYEQVVARIVYNTHALEKGLAHTSQWQPGRGRVAVSRLARALSLYMDRGFSLDDYAFVQGRSILRHYIDRHADNPSSIAYVQDVVSADLLSMVETLDVAGAGISEVVGTGSDGGDSFETVVRRRRSIREFSGEPIDENALTRALELALCSPSVCNRQGWKVRETADKELARRVLAEQRGFAYSVMPERLLTITVSTSAFVSPVERNQSFVDGGLFAMTLLYALESQGLAAVPLNACLYWRAQKTVRALLDIPPSEVFIMFIAVGSRTTATVAPVADRKPLKHVRKMEK